MGNRQSAIHQPIPAEPSPPRFTPADVTEVGAPDTDEADLYKNMRKTVKGEKRWFLAHHEALKAAHPGKWLVIRHNQVVGVADEEMEAIHRFWTPGALVTPTFEMHYEIY